MIASLAVCDCIEEVTGITAKIKWPNDILVGGKKVSGILACSGISPSKGVYAVVGIGVNADTEFKDRPEIEEISTSLTTVAGRKVSRLEVLLSLLNNFEQRCDKSFTGESQLGDWTEALVTLGQKVTVRTGEKIITGMAESVDKHGRLLLRLEDGELKVIPAGDVTLRA
jgi:biotin-[acetyl-CoA-carboxylase] ligase BirA-like protein